ncbi:MAG: precorrin-2 C(20)-methyltransferase [Pseudomonadota bacterium]
MTGTLYGVGVGPGDPELVTLKAARLIQSASVIAYPAPDDGNSFARRIVADLIPGTAREYPIIIPMRAARFPAQEVYDQAAADLAVALEQGQDVVVLCEGDPFFYGSFMYLFARLFDRFPTEIVPGVSSLGAVAAAAQKPLCARSHIVTVLPGTMEAKDLRDCLTRTDAAAVMKLGRHFAKVREIIDDLGLTDRATLVQHASLPDQQVCPLADAPETVPYFSMVLIPGEDAYA